MKDKRKYKTRSDLEKVASKYFFRDVQPEEVIQWKYIAMNIHKI